MKIIFLLSCLALFLGNGIAFAKDGMLLVMFGTSYKSAQIALDNIEDAYKVAYQDKGPIAIAYTSSFIRKKLKKEGITIASIDEAMHNLADNGVTNLTIQSFHVSPAAEYNETERMIVKHLIANPTHFKTAKLGAPLLVSVQDMHKVVDVVLQAIPQERTPKDAVIFMGHGNNHGPGDLVLQATASALNNKDAHVYLACVEGALTFDAVLAQIKEKKNTRVWLIPFMIVAGDHALNDLMGSESDSWASILKKEGFEVHGHIVGLGQLKGIRDIFMEHTKNAHLDIASIRKNDE